MKRMKLAIFVPTVMALALVSSSYVFAGKNPVDHLKGIENHIEARNLAEKVYAETPFVRDPDKEIKMHEVGTPEEAKKIADEVYNTTPFIKEAAEGDGSDKVSTMAETLPYYFSFDFDATLKSSSITNNVAGGTIRITSTGDWEQKPNEYEDTIYDYYDVTLYAGGVAQGTYRFDTGAWQHADWTDIPKGTIYFVMTKHYYTYSGAPFPDYNGDIKGNGTALNE